MLISYSGWREDIMLLRALAGVHHEDAFYIDAGANSPSEDSVTKIFYDHGWHGINIDASPHWYSKLLAERPRDINIHAAVSDKEGRLTLFDQPEGGLGTLVEEFADRHEKEYGIAKRGVEVEAVTLTSLCEQYAPSVIHFLKIDVEGFEEQAIRGMDFSRFRPWIVCVEATEPNRFDVHTHEKWESMLIEANYTFVQFDGQNRWYVANEKPELMSAFQYHVQEYVHHSFIRRIEELEARNRHLEQELSQAEQALANLWYYSRTRTRSMW